MVLSVAVAGCGAAGDEGSPVVESQSASQVDSLQRSMGKVTSALVTANLAVTTGWKLLARVEIQENEMVEFYAGAGQAVHLSGRRSDWGGQGHGL